MAAGFPGRNQGRLLARFGPAPRTTSCVVRDAAGQRLFRELVGKRIAWATVTEVRRLIAVYVVAVSLPARVRSPTALQARALPRQPPREGGAGQPGVPLARARIPPRDRRRRPGARDGPCLLARRDYLDAPFDRELIDVAAREEGIGALLAVPICFAGVVRGVLHAGLRRNGAFGPEVAEALSRVATYAGAALAAAADRARVEELARLRERRRLVRALHDDLGQHLFSVGVQARRARESAVTGHADHISHLHELRAQVTQASGALRSTLNALTPVQTPGSTLAVMLSEDVAAFQRRTCLPAHLIVLGELAPVEADKAELLARIVGEGLRNVERHAHASEVVVTLRVDAFSAELTVQDDGIGPPGTGGSGGRLGLATLREDVARLRGELRLTSNDDPGATLRAWLPIG